MNFYYGYYVEQIRSNENSEDWVTLIKKRQGIIMIANDCNEAYSKFYECLDKIEEKKKTLNYRIKPLGFVECIGLDMKRAYDNSINIIPITKKEEE